MHLISGAGDASRLLRCVCRGEAKTEGIIRPRTGSCLWRLLRPPGSAPDGQPQPVAKVRARRQVQDKLIDLAVKACGSHRKYNLAVANGGAPEEMAELKEKLKQALPDYDHIWEGELDGTLSVYIGDGVLGAGVQVLD